MQVTCHPRLGGASQKGDGGHRNIRRSDFYYKGLIFPAI